MVAVHSPPPERKPFVGKYGQVYFSVVEIADRKTVIVNADDLSVVSQFKDHYWMSWSPDSKYVVDEWMAEGRSGTCVAIYDVRDASLYRAFETKAPSKYEWSTDGNRILIADRNGASVRTIEDEKSVSCESEDSVPYWENPCWSPDGKFVAAWGGADMDGLFKSGIRVWNSETGKLFRKIETETLIGGLGWSPDGGSLIYSEPEVIHVLNSATFEETRRIEVEDIEPVAWLFSPDGKFLTFKDCQFLRVLEFDGGSDFLKIAAARNGWFSFAWSPDGRHILLENRAIVAICDGRSGQYLGFKHFENLLQARWSPKGNAIVLWKQSAPPQFVPVNLSVEKVGTRVFDGGETGSPGWENEANPKTLEECFVAFDKALSPDKIEKFKQTKEDSLGRYGGGSFITDSMMCEVYDKWGRNDLAKWFRESRVTDPRDITDITLVSYWRHLHNMPLDVDKQIREHLAWWARGGAPLVRENRKLPDAIVSSLLISSWKKTFSIKSLEGRAKVVMFISNGGSSSASLLRGLSELQKKYSKEKVSFVAITFDYSALGMRKPKHSGSLDDSPAQLKAIVREKTLGIDVAKGSREFWKNFKTFAGDDVKWVPQTLVITGDDFLVSRLNGNSGEDADYLRRLDKQITAALKAVQESERIRDHLIPVDSSVDEAEPKAQ